MVDPGWSEFGDYHLNEEFSYTKCINLLYASTKREMSIKPGLPVPRMVPHPLGCIDIQGSHMEMEARCRKARKWLGLQSNRVAIRRNCLSPAKQRSMRLRRR